jgi:hypothetical protein
MYSTSLLHVLRMTLHRYSEIAPFGKDAIRKFPSNSSEMKKLAARDLENLLQVNIPFDLNS